MLVGLVAVLKAHLFSVSEEELGGILIGSAVRHAEHASFRMLQVLQDLIREETAALPATPPSFTCSTRISRLEDRGV